MADRAFCRLDGPTQQFCMHFYAKFTHVFIIFIIAFAYLNYYPKIPKNRKKSMSNLNIENFVRNRSRKF